MLTGSPGVRRSATATALARGPARYNPPRSSRARSAGGSVSPTPADGRGRHVPGGSVTRFQKLVAATLAMTLALVIVGVIVRATGSGLGCPDWPFCYGQVIPPLEFKAWAEWIHRLIAAVIGVMTLGIAVLAVVDHRDRRGLVAASVGVVALVGFQAWLGRETVRLGNSGASVTAHLAAAMAVAGLLAFLLVRAGYPARLAGARREPASHPAHRVHGGRHLRPAHLRRERDRCRRGARLPGLAAHGWRRSSRRSATCRRPPPAWPSPTRSTATSASWSGWRSPGPGSSPGGVAARVGSMQRSSG